MTIVALLYSNSRLCNIVGHGGTYSELTMNQLNFVVDIESALLLTLNIDETSGVDQKRI